MRKPLHRLIALSLLLCAAFLLAAPPSALADAPKVRALLIACENFLYLDSLAPSTSNNVFSLVEVFTQMSDSLVSLHTEIDSIGSEQRLDEVIRAAFAGAQPEDVCLFYVSTHGRFRPEAPEYPAVITLTDGITEFEIDGSRLQALLDGIPGMKVVLIDACNSGAMAGKGVIPNLNDQPTRPFHRLDYKVLTSAGGNELSWNWSETEQNRPLSLGSSYFAKALANGLGLHGQYGADLDQNGEITLSEIYRYLLDNHGSSTVHVYPQDDDYVLFPCDPRAPRPPDPANLLSTISFASDVLRADEPQIEFSFTVHQPARLQYQLVYAKNGAWDWDQAALFPDVYETGEDGEPADSDARGGVVLPGRKQRSIEVSGIGEGDFGYALLQILTLGDPGPEVHINKLLAVVPIAGDPNLRIDAFGEQFTLSPEEELAVQVVHEFPLQLTVSVHDAQGLRLRRLAVDQTSRPLRLMPEGSLFYWNGCDENGNRVPPGTYTLYACAYVGDTLHEAGLEIELLN